MSEYNAEYWKSKGYTAEKAIRTYNPVSGFIMTQLFPHNKVLDAGCAMGYLTHCLQEFGADVKGCDITKYCVDNAHSTVKDKIIQADVSDMPYEDEEFDIAVCVDVIEHVDDPLKAIKELGRVTWKWLFMIITVTDDPNDTEFHEGHGGDATHKFVTGEMHWRNLMLQKMRNFERMTDKELGFLQKIRGPGWTPFIYRRM